MCGSMVDIQSATAEIMRGIKKKKPQGKNIMSASATQGGHNKHRLPRVWTGQIRQTGQRFHSKGRSVTCNSFPKITYQDVAVSMDSRLLHNVYTFESRITRVGLLIFSKNMEVF